MGEIVTSGIYYLSVASRFVFKGLGFLDLSGLSKSTIILIIFAAFVIFVIGFTLGRSRILISLISIFVAWFFEKNLPFFSSISGAVKNIPEHTVHLGVFIILFVMIFFIFNRSVLKSRVTLKDASLFPIMVLSLLNVGLLMSVVSSYLPSGEMPFIPPDTSRFFDTKNAPFYWAVAALVAVFFMKGKRESSNSSLPSRRTRRFRY